MKKSIDREIKKYIDKIEGGGAVYKSDFAKLLVAIGKKMIEEEYIDKYNLFHKVTIQGNKELDNYKEIVSKEITEAYAEDDFSTADSGGSIMGYSMESYEKAEKLAREKLQEIEGGD